MLTLREQLKDPLYRKWFATPPRVKNGAATSPPWIVYVQKEEGGPWSRAEFDKWSDGYRFVARNLKRYHDMALHHKRQEFRPPVVSQHGKRKYLLPEAPGHHWCGYCRRVTRFGYFQRHHAMPKWTWGDVLAAERRCIICGIRLAAIRRYP